ncbi:putative ABC transport system permease protein [Thermomonospora echinospora]|uniref:Putative ABC transport system permease protein n=1 Tax=Thermomonospora echinospora TaxID=1992 RepID=A0A1H6CBC4_9ACTN|nr:ABC transporter permease [Thermomonospora echinospora]SEG70208.1 putative ABC transport system permease protein [Thermomonospora echinospora]
MAAVATAPQVGPLLAVVLLVLAAVAALVVRLGGLGAGREVAVAAVRAVGQLAAVSLLIAAVLRSAGWTGAFIAMMVAIAALTAARRIAGSRRAGAIWWAGVSIVAGVGPVLALVVGSTVVPAEPVSVLPIAGILIGGAMTATALSGRRVLEELHGRYGEYEAALALGLMPRDAVLEVCRPAAALALVPILDQTRTVGLVTLPGAYVGVILGGADPIQAGATQLLVLIGLLAAEAVCALTTLHLVAVGRLRP